MTSSAVRALILWLCFLSAISATAETWGEWAAEARKQHPLAGSFYWPRQGPMLTHSHSEAIAYEGQIHLDENDEGRLYRLIAPDAHGLMRPPGVDIFLLGEVHDNPMHHRIRAWIIRNQPVPGALGAAVFEQVRGDQRPVLERLRPKLGHEKTGVTADALLQALEWEKSGWPPAAIYRPLFDAVLGAGLPIYPGEPARGRVRALARGDTSALGPGERARLRLDAPLPAPLAEALSAELAASHCGALPPRAIPGMAAAQRYRDASMADALLAAEQRHGSAILIAGNGHVRADRGVPWHIRQRKPHARVMSVVLAEVEDGKTDPAAYLPRDPEGKPAADLVIFTPGVERGDPCESFKKAAAPSPPRP